jgi:hypothetical protein
LSGREVEAVGVAKPQQAGFLVGVYRGTKAANERLRKLNSFANLPQHVKDAIQEPVLRHECRFAAWKAGTLTLLLVFMVVGSLVGYLLTHEFIVSYGILFVTMIAFYFYIDYVRTRRFTDALIIEYLIDIAYLIESNPDTWGELKFKRKVLRAIEAAASVIERDIPRSLPTGDASTAGWMRQRAWQIAAALRECKTVVAMSGDSARQDLLTNRLLPSLVAAAQSRWEDMIRAEDVLPKSDSRLVRFGRTAFAFGISIFALLLLGVSVYMQTDEGKELLQGRNVEATTTANAATVISSIAAAILLYRAQTGKTSIGLQESTEAKSQDGSHETYI